MRLARGISAHIRAANTIWPVNMREFEERRLQLDKALECCNVLQDELNYIAKVLPADKNKYTRIAMMNGKVDPFMNICVPKELLTGEKMLATSWHKTSVLCFLTESTTTVKSSAA